MDAIRLYDNGGKTADRYTALNLNVPEKGGAFYAIGFNENPYDPQGTGMHVSAMPGRHLGKRINADQLPPKARRFFDAFIAEFV